MKRNFWKNKKVFLTGHTGFKGAWATIWLNDMGAEVYGFSLQPSSTPSLYETAKLSSRCKETIADICNYQDLYNSLNDFQPEIVIHMAAQSMVRYSYEQPIETYATNVMGTVNILEAIRRTGSVRAALMITTDKCYENLEHDKGYKEEDAMGGYDPYSSSKGCAELVISAMRRSFFQGSPTNIASARAGNVIGGGDWTKDRLVPDIVRSFSNEKTVQIRSPLSIRPWQHVLEPLNGYFTLLEMLYNEGSKFAEAWNFGPEEDEARNVQFVVDYLSKTWGTGARWELDPARHPHEAKLLKLNITKAMSRLNWRPWLKVEDSLDLTCKWYKDFYKGSKNPLEITLDQIKEYEMRIK